jgi:bifunctional DNA-binding transcriptional regulator/antitoxin component of YhaV-PrlF toxin-antitoxin module
MPRIQQSKSRYSITLPGDLVKLKGWKKGDYLEYVEERPGTPAIQRASSGTKKQSCYSIQESGGQHDVTIPSSLMTLYGWKKGDVLEFVEDRPGVVTIRKVR